MKRIREFLVGMFFLLLATLFDREFRRNTLMPPNTPMSRFMKLWIVAALAVIIINMLSGCASVQPRVAAVKYEENVVNQLIFLYDHIQDVEFAFCGFGRLNSDTLHFERVELATISKADSISVNSRCPKWALIHGHSHPKSYGAEFCRPSNTDLKYIRDNAQIVLMVICYNPARPLPYGFVWVSKQDALRVLKELSQGGQHGQKALTPPDGTRTVQEIPP